MAAGTDMLLKFCLLISIFAVKKASFVSTDVIGLCFGYDNYVNTMNESFIYSSLYNYKKKDYGFILRPHRTSVSTMLLLLCGDIETCPGPIMKCNTCTKTIRKNQRSQNCSVCNTKFHEKCLVDKLENGGERFYCTMCDMRPDTDENNNVNDTGMFKTLLSYLKPRGLKILHQNVNGIISKIDKVKILLGETRKNVQILCITETKLNKHILDSEISVDGYIIVRRDRHSGPGGGVCMFIRNDLNWQRRNDLECETIETIWIEIFIKHSKSIIISVTYRPPDTSKYSNKNFNTTFHDLINTAQVEDKEIILSGDFNCNYLKSSDHKDLKDIFKLNGLKQLIKQPTRTEKQSETLIDLILTTHEQNISNSFVYDHGISDHDLTGIIRKINCKKYEPRKIQTQNYKNFCIESYKDDLRNIPWENALRLTNLNQSWNHFKELVTDCIDRHAPRTQKKVTGKDCPWLTSQIKTTIHQRDFMLRKAKRTNKDVDWAEYKRADS